MRHLLPAAVFEALVLTLAACNGGHLTRARAKAQLDQRLKQETSGDESESDHILFEIGTVSGACEEGVLKGYDVVDSQPKYTVLAATGFVIIRPIKKHVWRVDLTERGQQSISGKPYAHKQRAVDCDEWLVDMPTAKFDHLDVTGIVEDGPHAKVDASFTFLITPVGLDVRKAAPPILLEIAKKKLEMDRKQYPALGSLLENRYNDSLNEELVGLLGSDIVYAPKDSDRYVKKASFTFEKYDDGWKLPPENDK
jgi:hypothetical protein